MPQVPQSVEIPPHLEQVVILCGPVALRRITETAGGIAAAAKKASVSLTTLSRWLYEEPGQIFGSRKRLMSYRSTWVGYPPPFPGMDRVCEQLYGPGSSYVGMLVRRHGLARTLKILRSPSGFGLKRLDRNTSVITAAAKSVGAPNSTWRRWMASVRYPTQWRALDALAADVSGKSWLETVLQVVPEREGCPAPAGALMCLMLEFASDAIDELGRSPSAPHRDPSGGSSSCTSIMEDS